MFAGAEGTVYLFFSSSPSSFNICFSGSSNCFSPLSLHLSPSFLRFSANKWPVLQRKFFGGFPQLFFSTISTFVSQLQQMAGASEKVLWKVPQLFWCFRKSCLEDSLNCSSLHVSPSFLRLSATNGWCFRKGGLEGSRNCSSLHIPSLIPSSEGNGWLVLQKRFFRIVLLCYLYICLPVPCDSLQQIKGSCFRKGSLEGSHNCFSLRLSPSLLLARVLREFSTSPIR